MEFLRSKKLLALVCVLLLIPLLVIGAEEKKKLKLKRSVTWPGKGDGSYSVWESNHSDLDKTSVCGDCHDDGRSRTNPPKSHNSHDIVWKREHGKWMQQKYGFRSENVCVLCHKDSFCTGCHMQTPPQDHSRYWRLRGHGVSVGLDRDRCERCHISVDFCERCHQQTEPISHLSSLWGGTRNQHCVNCHFPPASTVTQRCDVCHVSITSHDRAPTPPAAVFHVAGATCRTCHVSGGALLSHADSGLVCTTCHNL